MGRWFPKEERLKLGERAVYLRDVEKLKWKDIAERLGLFSGTNVVYHYKKYKTLSLTVKSEMTFKQVEVFASKYNIERGWVWLYENGFKRRVPLEVQQKIEDAKLGISEAKPRIPPRDRREIPRKRGRPPFLKERSY